MKKPQSTLIRIEGQRFGRWTAIEWRGEGKWLCRCDCGNEVDVQGATLRNGRSTQCFTCNMPDGQISSTHGKSKTRAYNIWCHMRRRCYDEGDKAYFRYGGRGYQSAQNGERTSQLFMPRWAIPRRGCPSTVTPITTVITSRAPVDQEKLRAIIGDAVKEAEADDPKRLRAEIARLTALTKAPTNIPQNIPVDPQAIENAEARGVSRGFADASRQASTSFEALKQLASTTVKSFADSFQSNIRGETLDLAAPAFTPSGSLAADRPASAPTRAPGPTPVARKSSPAASGDGTSLGGSAQKILDAIRWWNVLGVSAPSHAQVGFVSGFSHKSGTWATYLSRLRSAGLIEGRGDLVLTEAGLAAANEPGTPPTGEHLRATVLAKVNGPLTKILTPIFDVYPSGLSHADAGEASGYSSSSGTWATYLSRLRSLDLIEGRGELKAQGWLFP